MSCFPLYDSFLQGASDDDLSTEEKQEFTELIPTLNQKGYDLIYVLVKMYANNHEEGHKKYMLPYSGNYLGMNIQFDLEKFPDKLKQLLYNFVKTHKKTMDETDKFYQDVSSLTQNMIELNDILV